MSYSLLEGPAIVKWMKKLFAVIFITMQSFWGDYLALSSLLSQISCSAKQVWLIHIRFSFLYCCTAVKVSFFYSPHIHLFFIGQYKYLQIFLIEPNKTIHDLFFLWDKSAKHDKNWEFLKNDLKHDTSWDFNQLASRLHQGCFVLCYTSWNWMNRFDSEHIAIASQKHGLAQIII